MLRSPLVFELVIVVMLLC